MKTAEPSVYLDKCHLCDKMVWPDDQTSMVDGKEVHRVCGLDFRVTGMEQKLSELSYRVPV